MPKVAMESEGSLRVLSSEWRAGGQEGVRELGWGK